MLEATEPLVAVAGGGSTPDVARSYRVSMIPSLTPTGDSSQAFARVDDLNRRVHEASRD